MPLLPGPRAAAATARPLAEGTTSNYLDRAMEHLTGDVVIMGGYQGVNSSVNKDKPSGLGSC
jgi:hypothetical protein